MAEMPKFTFSTGSDQTITGMCKPCKDGRHTECRSLDQTQPEDVWPFFDAEDAPVGLADWECECLAQSTRRKDHAKHQGFLE